MNKIQKFCVLLWAIFILIVALGPAVGGVTYEIIPALILLGVVSFILWGLVWVFRDKKK